MKSKLKYLRNIVLYKALGVDISLLQNTHSLQQLSKLLQALSGYYPYTSSALNPASLNLVLNDIAINTRTSIVELGSGISTLAIAKLLEINDIEATFHSVEENESWATYLTSCLKKEKLDTFCTIHHVPVQAATGQAIWYDHAILERIMKHIGSIDCLLIDGPIAYSQGKQFIRQGADYLFDTLADRHAIFLDDTNRPGEREIIERWRKQHGHTFEVSDSISYCLKGSHFNIG